MILYSLHSFVTPHQTLLYAKSSKHWQEAITLGLWHTGFLLANLRCHFCSWFIHFNLTLWSCCKFNWPRVHGMSVYPGKPMWFCNLAHVGDPGEALSKVLYGMDGLPTRNPTPHPYVYHFRKKRNPFRISSIDSEKWNEFPHIPKKHFIPCCVIGLSFYIAKNANKSESPLVISTAIRYESVKYSQTLWIRTLKGP